MLKSRECIFIVRFPTLKGWSNGESYVCSRGLCTEGEPSILGITTYGTLYGYPCSIRRCKNNPEMLFVGISDHRESLKSQYIKLKRKMESYADRIDS